MNNKRMTVLTPLLLILVLLWAFQASAYFVVSSNPPQAGNCTQCHPFPGAGAHDFHIDADISCAACHGDFSGPVETSTCSVCHTAAGILDLHAGVQAPNDEYCGYCHEGVDVEARSWTELKNIFE